MHAWRTGTSYYWFDQLAPRMFHTGGNDDGVGEYDEDDDVSRNTIVNAIPNTIVNDWYVSMGTRSIM